MSFPRAIGKTRGHTERKSEREGGGGDRRKAAVRLGR